MRSSLVGTVLSLILAGQACLSDGLARVSDKAPRRRRYVLDEELIPERFLGAELRRFDIVKLSRKRKAPLTDTVLRAMGNSRPCQASAELEALADVAHTSSELQDVFDHIAGSVRARIEDNPSPSNLALQLSPPPLAFSSLAGFIAGVQMRANTLTLSVLTAAHGVAGADGCAGAAGIWPALSRQRVLHCTRYIAGDLSGARVQHRTGDQHSAGTTGARDWALAHFETTLGPDTTQAAVEALIEELLRTQPALNLSATPPTSEASVAVFGGYQPGNHSLVSEGTLTPQHLVRHQDAEGLHFGGTTLDQDGELAQRPADLDLPAALRGMSGAPLYTLNAAAPLTLRGLTVEAAALSDTQNGERCYDFLGAAFTQFGELAPWFEAEGLSAARYLRSHRLPQQRASTLEALRWTPGQVEGLLGYQLDLCLEGALTDSDEVSLRLEADDVPRVTLRTSLAHLKGQGIANLHCAGVPWQRYVALADAQKAHHELKLYVDPPGGHVSAISGHLSLITWDDGSGVTGIANTSN